MLLALSPVEQNQQVFSTHTFEIILEKLFSDHEWKIIENACKN